MGFAFWYGIPDIGLEKGGLAKAKKCPGDTFLARGRVLWLWGRGPEDRGHRAILPTKPLVKTSGFFLFTSVLQQQKFNILDTSPNALFAHAHKKAEPFFELVRLLYYLGVS